MLAPTGFAFTERFSQAKKRATEVAQNALRARCLQKDLRLFPFVRVFPDKKSEACEKHEHEADGQHSGDHHVVEKHDASPAVALLRWSQGNQSSRRKY
jgi:hypothetical protein